ncbi:uncharacterized protein CLAFUR5_00412 [Fulvia fulva]|uniref:Uncharacterized protein n=2 Tax=Passalora fulva TaxID=5499 RepID=A0A9Q8P4M9_PASFU|nr:uncharacterized protein CLAFUR5_00412 [Fulvia fulva]UJO12991.1 hypothetical protein CLAFUR5_00412 [Fulvia fulva]
MDFKKLNQQRVTKTSTIPTTPYSQPQRVTDYQKEKILNSINQLNDKIADAQETATRLEREMPKARKELELAQAGVAKAATSYTRGRLTRAREKLSDKELAIKGTAASIQAWEDQIAQKKKILVDDGKLSGSRSGAATPVPVQRVERKASATPMLKKAPPKITKRTVKVPLGPSMKEKAERQAEEIVRRRAVREREIQERRDAAAMEAAAQPQGQQEVVETAPVAQMISDPKDSPSCSKRKRAGDEGHAQQKKPKLDSNESEGSEVSKGSETSQPAKARPAVPDNATTESMRAKGKLYVYHPKRRTFDYYTIGENDTIVGLAQTRRPSGFRSGAGSAAPIADPITPTRERDGETDYQLHGLVNTKLSCFSNGALQMLGAALTHEQIEQLRGDGDLATFGLKHDDFLMLKTDADGKMRKSDRDNLESLRSRISIHAAKNGEIPIAPYLGQVLLDMREGIFHKSKMPKDKHVANACLMQQVFAYGAEGGARSMYDGDCQQDARLYMGALIDSVGEEHKFLGEIFQSTASVVLERSKCSHKSEHLETGMSCDASSDIPGDLQAAATTMWSASTMESGS